jgi:hypothetical protein
VAPTGFFQTVYEPGGISMNDIQKSRIRLKHWIDHNFEHIKGYEEVSQLLDNNNCGAAAEMIRRGTRLIEDANTEFENALESLGGEDEKVAHDDSEDHSHGHSHGHSH